MPAIDKRKVRPEAIAQMSPFGQGLSTFLLSPGANDESQDENASGASATSGKNHRTRRHGPLGVAASTASSAAGARSSPRLRRRFHDITEELHKEAQRQENNTATTEMSHGVEGEDMRGFEQQETLPTASSLAGSSLHRGSTLDQGDVMEHVLEPQRSMDSMQRHHPSQGTLLPMHVDEDLHAMEQYASFDRYQTLEPVSSISDAPPTIRSRRDDNDHTTPPNHYPIHSDDERMLSGNGPMLPGDVSILSAAEQTQLDEMEAMLNHDVEYSGAGSRLDKEMLSSRAFAGTPTLAGGKATPALLRKARRHAASTYRWRRFIAAVVLLLLGYWVAGFVFRGGSKHTTAVEMKAQQKASTPNKRPSAGPVAPIATDSIPSETERQLREKIASLESMMRELVAVKEQQAEMVHQNQAKQEDKQVAIHDQFVAFQGVVQTMIESSLDRFANDRVGMADYALAAGGAHVVPEFTSASFNPFAEEEQMAKGDGGMLHSLLHAVGLEMGPSTQDGMRQRGPVTALQADTSLGNCWPMHGDHGVLTVSLSRPIQPTAITLDHIPRALALQQDVRSAPRDFEVWSMNGSMEETLLVKGTFDTVANANSANKGVQTFPISASVANVKQVQLRIFSNHGHDLYTCLYRYASVSGLFFTS